MIRAILLAALVAYVVAEPDYPAARPPTSYGAPAKPKPTYKAPANPRPSYGAPPPAPPAYGPKKDTCPKKCFDKTVYTTKTNVQTEHHTVWKTQAQYVPTTLYQYVKETLYYPTTVVQYSFVTHPLPDQVVYETKVFYKTGTVTEAHLSTVQEMMPGTHYYVKTHTDTQYCTDTVQVPYYVTVQEAVYKTVQEPHYVTVTSVQQKYTTVTENEPHYVTQTQVQTQQQHNYVTVTEHKQGYVTVTSTKTTPTYTTVCNQGYGY